jgi:REP element-mobilizing transposase RayT
MNLDIVIRLYRTCLEWCPKKALFRKELLCRKRREGILREVAERHGIEIVEISVVPDHVHLIAGILPTII